MKYLEFREWLQDIKAPEEFFYATLARVDRKSAIDLDKKIYMGMKYLQKYRYIPSTTNLAKNDVHL